MKRNRLLVLSLSLNWCFLFVTAMAWLASSRADAVTFSTLAHFSGTNGAQPMASLLLGADGNFYGTTAAGGQNGCGTVFRASPTGIVTTLASFDSTNTGAKPLGPLVQGTDGSFYGTASAGGAYGYGTVFMLSASNTLSAVAAFAGTNGAQPCGGLVSGTNGVFYGTTYGGGDYGYGTIFTVSTDGTLSTLFSFDNATNGAYPFAGLTAGTGGTYYGTTSAGGTYNSGTVFRFALAGADTNNTSGSNTNGSTGAPNIAPGITLTNLYVFTGAADGAAPQAALLRGVDGSLYGTTRGGGTNNVSGGGNGTVFKLTTAGAFSRLFSFARSNGICPAAALVQGTDGNLYGTTRAGGPNNAGTAFSLTTAGGFTLLHTFAGGSGGADPYYGGLTQGTDSNFYGVTSGGSGGKGTFYRVAGFAPYVTGSSVTQTVLTGSTVTLAVAAGGSAPLTYHWLRNSNYLKDGSTFSGTTTPALTIANATTANSGTYMVVVKNAAGSATNPPIVLTVLNPYGTNQPKLRITSPAPNAQLKNPVVTLSGTTSGSVPVDQVYCRVNDDGWQLATAQGDWSHWTADLLLAPGANLIQAYALNIVGTPSLTNTLEVLMGVPSPFTALTGAYNGLFYDTNGVSAQSAGFLSLSLRERGVFSGHVQLGAKRYAMSGLFNLNGLAQVTFPQAQPEPLHLALQLDLTGGTEQLAGSLGNASWTAMLLAARAPFDGRTNLAPQAGRYTLVLPGAASAASEPGGDSYGALKVDTAGRLRFVGALADGTKVTQAVRVSRVGQWPLYASLYRGGGLLLGACLVSNTTTASLSGPVVWSKPGLSKAAYYPQEFTMTTTLLGSPYSPPVDTANPLSYTNADLVLSGGDLAQNITNRVALGWHNRISVVDGLKLSLYFTPATGLLRGSAVLPGETKPAPFGGVVLQDSGLGRGCFFGPSQSGALLLGPESTTP